MSAGPSEHEHAITIPRNARYGMIFFVIYSIIYGGFVALSAFAPHVMEKPVFHGVNLAVVYGFVLIALAFLLALLYMAMCSRKGTRGDVG